MPSTITSRRQHLAQRHYIRQATTPTHWFDCYASRIEEYRQKFGDKFCFVINGSTLIDDAWVIPYEELRTYFVTELLDHRNRWIGTVQGGILRLSRSGNTLNVKSFHNAFDWLDA